MPVEDQLVLAANRVAERDETRVVARACDEHLFALAFLSDVIRRSGDVREQLRAAEREIRRRRSGLPHVLADGRTDQRLAELQQDQVASRSEVAVLVEDAVVREEALADERLHLTARAHRARVEEITVECRRADQRHDPAARPGDAFERALRRADEPGAEEEIFRRVAGDDQLGEEDDVDALLLGLLDPRDDALGISVQVADHGVDLGERKAHPPKA